MSPASRYYGLPSLSWRDAAHDLLAANATGFTFEDIYFDKGHPNGYNGHRQGTPKHVTSLAQVTWRACARFMHACVATRMRLDWSDMGGCLAGRYLAEMLIGS